MTNANLNLEMVYYIWYFLSYSTLEAILQSMLQASRLLEILT